MGLTNCQKKYQNKNAMRPWWPNLFFLFDADLGSLPADPDCVRLPDRVHPGHCAMVSATPDGVDHPHCVPFWLTLDHCVLYWIHNSLPV